MQIAKSSNAQNVQPLNATNHFHQTKMTTHNANYVKVKCNYKDMYHLLIVLDMTFLWPPC